MGTSSFGRGSPPARGAFSLAISCGYSYPPATVVKTPDGAGHGRLSRRLSRLVVPCMLATGSVVAAAVAARTWSRCLFTVASRTPPLAALGVRAVAGDAPAQW